MWSGWEDRERLAVYQSLQSNQIKHKTKHDRHALSVIKHSADGWRYWMILAVWGGVPLKMCLRNAVCLFVWLWLIDWLMYGYLIVNTSDGYCRRCSSLKRSCRSCEWIIWLYVLYSRCTCCVCICQILLVTRCITGCELHSGKTLHWRPSAEGRRLTVGKLVQFIIVAILTVLKLSV